MKNRINKKMLINIRVMITPSDVPKKDLILKFWNEYGDIVSTQFVTVIKFKDQEISFQDQFNGGNEIGRYPKCSLPFKTLDVLWNGDIPLCTYSEFQMGTPGGLILGNINKKSISEIWQDPIIKKYRDAHRNCKTEDMPICNGCIGT